MVSIVMETIEEIILDLMVVMVIIVVSVGLCCSGLNGKNEWFLLDFNRNH